MCGRMDQGYAESNGRKHMGNMWKDNEMRGGRIRQSYRRGETPEEDQMEDRMEEKDIPHGRFGERCDLPEFAEDFLQ